MTRRPMAVVAGGARSIHMDQSGALCARAAELIRLDRKVRERERDRESYLSEIGSGLAEEKEEEEVSADLKNLCQLSFARPCARLWLCEISKVIISARAIISLTALCDAITINLTL